MKIHLKRSAVGITTSDGAKHPTGDYSNYKHYNTQAIRAAQRFEAPHICSAASKVEHEAKKILQEDRSNRWLYLVARGKLELGLMLEILRYERIGTRGEYKICGLKKSNQGWPRSSASEVTACRGRRTHYCGEV